MSSLWLVGTVSICRRRFAPPFCEVEQKRQPANKGHRATDPGAIRLDRVLKRDTHSDDLEHGVERRLQRRLAVGHALPDGCSALATGDGKVGRFLAVRDDKADTHG